MNNKFKNYFFFILAAVLLPTIALTQNTVTFTNAAATGRTGPTQAQVTAAYDNTTLDDAVTITTQGIQEWTVPATAVYTIEVYGARGGGADGSNYGKGARMKGDFNLTADDVLKIVVGQMGGVATSGSGGGGTFVVKKTGSGASDITALIVAGGGGGVYTSSSASYNEDATTATSGLAGNVNSTGGTNGSGGTGSSSNGASGGGGLTGNGTSGNWGTYGESFTNGAKGGNHSANSQCVGGFGGGGGD